METGAEGPHHPTEMTIDPCSLYHGFKRIDFRGCNVKVNGSMYSVDNPDDFFTAVWTVFQLPRSLSRAAYEAECWRNGVTPLGDKEVGRFNTGACVWDLGTYFPTAKLRQEKGIPFTLHQIRARSLKDEHAQAAAAAPVAPPAPVMEGKLWEECRSCGAAPVHMPLHLCQRCWPVS
jgi:hypothetical protein